MSTKVTVDKTVNTDKKEVVFVVHQEHFDSLSEMGARVVLVEFGEGVIGEWRTDRGTGGATLREKVSGADKAYILADAFDSSGKGGKFFDELENNIVLLGVPVVKTKVSNKVDLSQRLRIIENTSDLIDELNDGFQDLDGGDEIDFSDLANPESDREPLEITFDAIMNEVILGQDEHGSIYLIPKKPDPILGTRAVELSEPIVENYIISIYNRLWNSFIAPFGPESIIRQLETRALELQGDEFLEVASRSYQDERRIVIDLGRRDGHVVEVTSSGWSVGPHKQSRYVFTISDALSWTADPLPCATPQDALNTLMNNVYPNMNMKEKDFHLVIGWLVNALFKSHVHPILTIFAGNGEGKSFVTKTLKHLIEGGKAVPELATVKAKDRESLVLSLNNQVVPTFDNLSNLDANTSDDLCTYVYGSVFSRRKLRTNRELKTYVKATMIMNGILGGQKFRADLQERMLPISLKGRLEKQSNNQELLDFFAEKHPENFGALLTLVSAVMAEIEKDGLPSLQDVAGERVRFGEFGGVLLILDELLGLETADSYVYNQSELRNEGLDDDPILWAILKVAGLNLYQSDDGVYRGTIGSKQILSANLDRSSKFSTGADVKLTGQGLGQLITRGDYGKIGLDIKKSDTRKILSTIVGPGGKTAKQTAYDVEISGVAATLMKDIFIDEEKNFED